MTDLNAPTVGFYGKFEISKGALERVAEIARRLQESLHIASAAANELAGMFEEADPADRLRWNARGIYEIIRERFQPGARFLRAPNMSAWVEHVLAGTPQSKRPDAVVQSALSDLVNQGFIQRLGGGRYKRIV